jgi:hypothetical protein
LAQAGSHVYRALFGQTAGDAIGVKSGLEILWGGRFAQEAGAGARLVFWQERLGVVSTRSGFPQLGAQGGKGGLIVGRGLFWFHFLPRSKRRTA